MDRDALVGWLTSGAVADATGHCLSWVNAGHAGYPYPEVSGLLLQLLCEERVAPARREALLGALLADSGTPVRRHGTHYAFDTAMALRGVLTAARIGPVPAGTDAVLEEWTTWLVASVAAGRASEPQSPTRADTRWSLAFGASMSKLALCLLEYRDRDTGQVEVGGALDRLARTTLDVQEPSGRFRIHALSSMTYLHAHCYALEGLVVREDPALAEPLRRGVEWMASIQAKSGGLAAWHDGSSSSGSLRADATAQAIRLWAAIDPGHYAGPIAAALRFLADLAGGEPGMPYEVGSSDRNAWAAIFTAQALAWAADPASIRVRGLV